RFAAAARISETNLALYRTVAQPIVRALVNRDCAEWMRRMHPLRLQYEFFSDANPAMAPIGALAEQIRKDRTSLAADNLFLALQEGASRQIVAALDAWRDLAEATAERAFLSIYGSPTLQAALGIDSSPQRARKAAKSPLHDELLRKRIAELKSRIPVGGAREA